MNGTILAAINSWRTQLSQIEQDVSSHKDLSDSERQLEDCTAKIYELIQQQLPSVSLSGDVVGSLKQHAKSKPTHDEVCQRIGALIEQCLKVKATIQSLKQKPVAQAPSLLPQYHRDQIAKSKAASPPPLSAEEYFKDFPQRLAAINRKREQIERGDHTPTLLAAFNQERNRFHVDLLSPIDDSLDEKYVDAIYSFLIPFIVCLTLKGKIELLEKLPMLLKRSSKHHQAQARFASALGKWHHHQFDIVKRENLIRAHCDPVALNIHTQLKPLKDCLQLKDKKGQYALILLEAKLGEGLLQDLFQELLQVWHKVSQEIDPTRCKELNTQFRETLFSGTAVHDQVYSSNLEAMDYFAKAIQIAEENHLPSFPYHQGASSLFSSLISFYYREGRFMRTLQSAMGEWNNRPQQFQTLFAQLDHFEEFFCLTKEEEALIKYLYAQADAIFTAQKGEFSSHHPHYVQTARTKKMKLEKRSAYATKRYQKALREFRATFKGVQTGVRDFQKTSQNNLRPFFVCC